MTIFPRYSLLTLLLLTAGIAGGLKIWHGPHQVVERVTSASEIEFTYTRDWRGHKIVDGPVLQRRFEKDKLVFFVVSYCRRGVDLPWVYGCYVRQHASPYRTSFRLDSHCPFTAEERRAFDQARAAELERVAAEGARIEAQYEGDYHGDSYNHFRGRGGIGLGR
jgi:hypothetical protein